MFACQRGCLQQGPTGGRCLRDTPVGPLRGRGGVQTEGRQGGGEAFNLRQNKKVFACQRGCLQQGPTGGRCLRDPPGGPLRGRDEVQTEEVSNLG